jgi:itaconate CoA-transferase
MSAEQLIAQLEEAQIANARMNNMHEVWQHPQLQARGRWAEVGSPAGTIAALLPPGSSNAFEPCMNPVPALGEHTETILESLGFSREAIQDLRRAGAI